MKLTPDLTAVDSLADDHHDSWTDDIRRRYLAFFDDARRWIGVELAILLTAATAAVLGAVLGLIQLWALTG